MTGGPVLLYRDTCRKCRRLSRIVTMASLGVVRRLPIDSPRGESLLAERGLGRSRPALVSHEGVAVGWRCLPAGMRLGVASIPARMRPGQRRGPLPG